MGKHHLIHDLLKEVKFVSPFISPRPAFHPCETEHTSSPSLESKPCPFAIKLLILIVVENQLRAHTMHLFRRDTFVT
jgi:hypothetical protein